MIESVPLRHSVGLRFAAAIELQPPDASAEVLKLLDDMLDEVDKTAKKLERSDEASHGSLIHALFVELEELLGQPGGPKLRPVAARLRNRLASHGGGALDDQENVEAGAVASDPAASLQDLAQIFGFVGNQVRALYTSNLEANAEALPSPDMRTQCVASDSIHGFFDQFGVNAATKVRSKKIVVSLELKPSGLDITALSQILYLLAHELVCHAYQSFEHPERGNSDDTCGWTDGWMDTLAWRLTERWIVRDIGRLPDWLTKVPDEARRRCRTFHDRRYAEPWRPPLRRSDLAQRRMARSSFDMLFEAWGIAPGESVDVEDHRATTFSVILNHITVDDDVRRLLVAALTTALDPFSGRSREVAGVCSAFIRHRNADALLGDLEALSALP